ncbi:MAG: hypothetical protein V4734_07675 [Terriglobus sp.]
MRALVLSLAILAGTASAQSPTLAFDVATIKPVDPGPKAGRLQRLV